MIETSSKIPLIYYGDWLDIGEQFPDNSIDLIVTSPPYNVKREYDKHDDDMAYPDYLEWIFNCFLLCFRKLKDGGRMAVNIGDHGNGSVPVHADFIRLFQSIGFLPMATIIWNKNTTSRRTAWGSWLSPSCPSFPGKFEYILLFAKKSRKLLWKGETDLTKEEFLKYTDSLWIFAPVQNPDHPAPFPEELPRRCIKMLSWKDSLVVDPFCGSGNAIKVAKELGRFAIGVDISRDYCERAAEKCGGIFYEKPKDMGDK